MTNDDFLMDEKNYENGIPTFRAEEPPGQPPPIESNADKNNTDESFTIRKQVGNNTYEQVRNPNYRPPGPRPTDDMLDLFEKRTAYETKVKEQLPDLDIDVVRIAERDTLSELYRDKSYLLYGRQTREDESRYQTILNRNMQLAMQKQAYARKLYDGAMNLFDEDVKTRRKYEGDIAAERAKAGIKMPSEDQRINNAFISQYGRPPTDQEFLDAKALHQAKSAGVKTVATEGAKVKAQRGMLSPDTLEQAYQYVKTKGEFAPEIARLFRVPGAQMEVMDYVSKRMNEDSRTGEDRVVKGAIQKSLGSSLTFQEKQRGAMGNFVSNINRQLRRIEELEKEAINRVGIRALDVPLRELNVRFKGSGHERALESYTSEISSEISKLMQGSQASIQQLPVEMQKKWDKIHDPNLSWKELKVILDTTRRQANDRLTAVDEEIAFTQGKMRGYGLKDYSMPGQSKKRTITLKSGKVIEVED
jgi:hypothetical protein